MNQQSAPHAAGPLRFRKLTNLAPVVTISLAAGSWLFAFIFTVSAYGAQQWWTSSNNGGSTSVGLQSFRSCYQGDCTTKEVTKCDNTDGYNDDQKSACGLYLGTRGMMIFSVVLTCLAFFFVLASILFRRNTIVILSAAGVAVLQALFVFFSMCTAASFSNKDSAKLVVGDNINLGASFGCCVIAWLLAFVNAASLFLLYDPDASSLGINLSALTQSDPQPVAVAQPVYAGQPGQYMYAPQAGQPVYAQQPVQYATPAPQAYPPQPVPQH